MWPVRGLREGPTFPDWMPAMPEEFDSMLAEVEALDFLPGAEGERSQGAQLVLLKKILRLKLAYERGVGEGGPLVAMSVGGTNVGKSTLFNALVGAELVVPDEKAGTTKFPVVSLPVGGGEALLSERFLPGYGREKLAGDLPETRMRAPDALRHFFYVLRGEGELAGLALFDAPDIDSITSRLIAGGKVSFLLAEDLMVASDVVLYVTTPEKYNVQRCMDFLTLALRLGKKVFVFLNKLDGPESGIPEHFLKELASESGLPSGSMPAMVTVSRAPAGGSAADAMNESLREFTGTLGSLLDDRVQVRGEVLLGAAKCAGELTGTVFDALAGEARLAGELRKELADLRAGALAAYKAEVEKQTAHRFDEVVHGVMEHFSLARQKWLPVPVRWVIHVPRKLGSGLRKGISVLFGLETGRTPDERAAAEIRKRLADLRQGVATLLRRGSEAGNPIHSAIYKGAVTEEFLGRDFQRELDRRLDELFAPIHNWEQTVREELILRVEGSKALQTLIQSVDVISITAGVVAAWLTGGFSAADLAIGPGSAMVVQKILESLGGKAYFGRKWKELLAAHEECFARAADEMVFDEINAAFPQVPDTGALDKLRGRLTEYLATIKG